MENKELQVIQIDAESWRIEDDFVRAFLFVGSRSALLVDSTTGTGDIAALVRELTDLPVMLINTHADADHIGGNGRFPNAYMHPAEYMYYAEMKKPGDAEACPVQDGQLIDLGGRVFEVILVPGHTHGSIALLDCKKRVLIAGDSISQTPVFIFGAMRSLPALQVSLARLQERQEDFDVIYPSHGRFPLGKEQIANEMACAEKLLAGELEAHAAPAGIPAGMYLSDGAGYFYNP